MESLTPGGTQWPANTSPLIVILDNEDGAGG